MKKADLYAEVVEPIFVKLPEEDYEPGMAGRLNKAMYGTRAAAMSWEGAYRQHLEQIGSTCGASSPCTFYHASRDLRLVVHGDDYTVLGHDSQLACFTEQMKHDMTSKSEVNLVPNQATQINTNLEQARRVEQRWDLA